jgi:two-component system, chemotaxis family, sensor histidine kinase and response regulator WspE
MNQPDPQDFTNLSLTELFRIEVENQVAVMTEQLLSLERTPNATHQLETLMRAAHSLKGAARIINNRHAVRITHAMEDCFTTAQKEHRALPPHKINILLQGIDLLVRISHNPEDSEPISQSDINALIESISAPAESKSVIDNTIVKEPLISPNYSESNVKDIDPLPNKTTVDSPKRSLRVTADNLNRLLGLASESLVVSRWLGEFTTDLLALKRLQYDVARALESLNESLLEVNLNERVVGRINELRQKVTNCKETLANRLESLESFNHSFVNLSNHLYQEVLDCRMRPFADGIKGLPRLVRDVGQSLKKEAKLEIYGESTLVDRELLERMEAPLIHLLKNAIDHSIEYPIERERLGKAREGNIKIEAHHSAGKLLINVRDDGQGINLNVLRRAIVEKGFTTEELVKQMNESELFEFLLLPGFSLKDSVTDISGRGVGLDAVHTMVKEVGGLIFITSEAGHGTVVQLQLPITLSLVRTLVVEIAGEPYALPLARIASAVKIHKDKIESIEGRQYVTFNGQQLGIVSAGQVLELYEDLNTKDELSIVILGDSSAQYGLIVDRFIGEHELVVHVLDPRLGKIKNISSASILPDRTPALILDIEDLIRSIETLISGGQLIRVNQKEKLTGAKKRKMILVVDDSLTVRELERKLLTGKGYQVEVATDGINGWNAVRAGNYDLVITDIDMPRMNGIELVSLIKKDNRLKSVPVMIVSYKDRDEDRLKGLEAGADYYLTKGSFHDETMLQAVEDLIGEPEQ